MEILSRLRNLGDDSEDERKEEGEETADENEIKISRTYDIGGWMLSWLFFCWLKKIMHQWKIC